MPKVDIHCKNSMERTGKEFRDLHEWMDKPQEILKIDHRRVRHDLSYIDEVKKKFKDKYEEWKVVKEFLLHIADDYKHSADRWGAICVNCGGRTYRKRKYCNTCLKKMKK